MTRPSVLLLLAAALFAPALASAASPPTSTHHLRSQLVAESTAAVPGTTLTVGLLFEHEPHWHTYWRNPGDSGLATELELVLPDGVVASPIAWPHPHRFELAQIVNYGFEGRRLLPVDIAIPADYAAASLPVRAKASWLICEEGGECIPGKAEYAFELPVAATAESDARWTDDFAAARADAPAPSAAKLAVALDGDHIVLDLADSVATPARWTWIPETPEVVANTAGPQWQRVAAGWQARWPRSEYFTTLPSEAAFVALDEAAGDAAPKAWRFAGIATAAAANPSGAAVAADTGTGGFGRVPTWIFAIAAVLFAVTIALVIRAASSRKTSPSRSEESDR